MTPFRRGRGAAALFTALVLSAAACGSGSGDVTLEETDDETASTTTSSTTSTTTTVPLGPFAPYTGEEIDADSELLEQPPIVVKIGNNRIDDSVEALTGIDAADIVIEERIEIDATRFFAVFHSELPAEIGSVRSGRTTDVELLPAFGTPILVYSGANGGVQGQLDAAARAGDVVLAVDDGRGVNMYRNREFRAPANLFTDPVDILELFGDEAGAPEPLVNFITSADPERPAGEPNDGVTVVGNDDVSFVHVPGTGYVRIQNGEVHATQDGTPIVVDNLLILETRYNRSEIYADSVDAVTTWWGPGHLMIDGQLWSGVWERPETSDGYRVVLDDGTELLLDPGRTWISLAPEGSYDFAVDAETAALATIPPG